MKGQKPILISEQKEVTDFFKKDYFRFVDATRKITERARDLIWKTPNLNSKDAVHLASAIEYANKAELDCIHSYDTDFLDLNGKLPISCTVQEPMPKQKTPSVLESLDRKRNPVERSIFQIRTRPALGVS